MASSKIQLTGWIGGLCYNGGLSTWQVPSSVRIGGLCHDGRQSPWEVLSYSSRGGLLHFAMVGELQPMENLK